MARNLVRVPLVPLDFARRSEAYPMELILDYDNAKIYAKSKTGTAFVEFNRAADNHIANNDIHVTAQQKINWTNGISLLNNAVDDINNNKLPLKAPLNSPQFTGTPKAPTASTTDNSTQIATTAFVQAAIKAGDAHSVDGKHVDDNQTSSNYLWTAAKIKAYADSLLSANDAMVFKGTIGTGGTITELPTSGYHAGWTYRAITAGTYAGKKCEVGDMIICIKDYSSSFKNEDWEVIQANIDGAVTNSDTSVNDGEIPIFNGATGKSIKTSGKKLPSGNLVGDTDYGTSAKGGVVKSSSANNKVFIESDGTMSINTIEMSKLSGVLPLSKGGTGKSSIAANAMLYASADNTLTEVNTTAFGRSLLAAASGTRFANLNADMVDGKHVDDNQTSSDYIWTAAKTKAYVDSLLSSNDAMVFKGTIGTGGTITALPTTGYQAGWSYKVITKGTYAGNACEPGDLIICVKDYVSGSSSNDDWTVVQTNLDGAVTSSSTSVTNNHVVVFDGTSGKVVKTSGKALPSGNIVGDTDYGTTSKAGVVKSSTSNNKIAIETDGTMTVNLIGVTKGGTGKSSIAANAMLYASANNTFAEVNTTAFGRSLLAAESGTRFANLNADMVDGWHTDSGGIQGKPWGYIPIVKTDGVMEVGKYIDFHNTSNDGIDYAYRFSNNANGELTGSGKFIAPEVKVTNKFNVNDKFFIQYNSTDDCIEFAFATP